MRRLAVGLLLAAATLCVYGQVAGFDFLAYDDHVYLNAIVRAGLTREGLAWAWAGEHGANWHPVTTLSHMLDCELYGLRPAGHHLTNLALHLANTLLLFGLLSRIPRSFWPGAFVAALFALHPLHVESVAWISARKDLLSALFFLLATAAYAAYAARGGLRRYAACAVLLLLGMMAKPMLVTAPLLFLILDFWPLGRLAGAPARRFCELVVEKLPLVGMSVSVSLLTLVAQHGAGAMAAMAELTLHARLANAVVAYGRYLVKMLWPGQLSIYYLHPYLPGGPGLPAWKVAGSVVLLLAITALAVATRHRAPHVLAGWCWYVAMLVPVIGLVQVGQQAMADRYTYLPLLGPFVMIAWTVAGLVRRGPPWLPWVAGLLASGCLLGSATWAWQVARPWRDSAALFEHALATLPDSAVVHNNLGVALAARGESARAIEHYRTALRLSPTYADAYHNLGNALAREGAIAEAIPLYRQALALKAEAPETLCSLGRVLAASGEVGEALTCYRQALTLAPDHACSHHALADALVSQARFGEAVEHYRRALALMPDNPALREALARAEARATPPGSTPAPP